MERIIEQHSLRNAIAELNNSFVSKTILDLTSEHVVLFDKEGEILFTNNDIFGITVKKSIGENIFKITPSTYLLILNSNLEEVNRTKKTATFETLFKVKKRLKSYEITLKPILDSFNEISAYALASVDTTEVKSAERKYSYQMNLEKLFLNISTKFINLPAKQIDSGIQEALELIGRFTSSEHAYIVLNENGDNSIGYQWHFNHSATTEQLCSITGLRELIGKTLAEPDFTEPRLIKPQTINEIAILDCPVFITPMILEKEQYGALVLIGKKKSDSDWSEEFTKPMMLFTNIFINTLERKKNALIEEKRKGALEMAIAQRTVEIERQKDKLLTQAKELQEAEILVRNANEELRQLNSNLEQTVNKRTSSLKKTNQELDRFVYSVSHDIKAPLASVKGLINLVRISSEDELGNNLTLMERSIDKLNGFVEDILAHSRNARVVIKPEVINFEHEIELAAEGLRHMEAANKVKLITSIKEATPSVTDQYRLQSVLKNLISNAVKYHNPEAKKSWVKIFVQSDKKEIKVRIADNGIGINKNYLDKIFEMFYRASEKSSGSGLGLYIVKETVEKLGGSITASSAENVGSSFELTIPNLV